MPVSRPDVPGSGRAPGPGWWRRAAVVGSSATNMSGSPASARAIMTRWFMPPENSCGYCLRRRGPSAMPTRSSRRSASRRAGSPVKPRCRRSTSPSCAPMRCTGFNAMLGSWEIRAMRPPRTCASSRSDKPADIQTVEEHLSARRHGRAQQAQRGEPGDALPTARFADDAQRPSARQRQLDTAHDRRRPGQGNGEIGQAKQGRVQPALRRNPRRVCRGDASPRSMLTACARHIAGPMTVL